MPELTKRFNALSAALETTRAEVTGLLHSVNEELSELPQRLYRGPEHDRLVTAVSLLMSIGDDLGRSIANLNRLSQGDRNHGN